MSVLRVVEYVRADGSSPYGSWFDGLDPQAAAKVATATLRLEMGNTSNVKWIGTVGEYILLIGGTKKRHQADIERAKELFAEYKARKAAAAKPKSKR